MIYREPGFLVSRMVRFHARPPSPLYHQTISQSSCVSPVVLSDGRGWAWSRIIRSQGGLALYNRSMLSGWRPYCRTFTLCSLYGTRFRKALTKQLVYFVKCINAQFWAAVHCKKELAVFPSPAGMSMIKLFLGGNNLIFPVQGEFNQ
jgi:hypothetical protein